MKPDNRTIYNQSNILNYNNTASRSNQITDGLIEENARSHEKQKLRLALLLFRYLTRTMFTSGHTKVLQILLVLDQVIV